VTHEKTKQQVKSLPHAVHHLAHESPKRTSSVTQVHSTYFTAIYETVQLLKLSCFKYCHYSTCISQLYHAFYMPSHLLWYDDDNINNNNKTEQTSLSIWTFKATKHYGQYRGLNQDVTHATCRVCAMNLPSVRLHPYVHGKYRVTWQRVKGCVHEGVNSVVV